MTRPKGTPNKTKVIEEKPLTKETLPKYEIAIGYGEGAFTQVVNGLLDFGYVCQGGVSVTNYRANDGRIEFVYCQAMIRKE